MLGLQLLPDRGGQLTVGLLIGFLLYVNSFYLPLRQLAAVWSSFQLAMASLDRISDVLALEPNLPQLPPEPARRRSGGARLRPRPLQLSRRTADVLRDATFALEHGKTYALVGPTGGGKTTTASLMARLYDPTGGRVLLDGRDIRSYPPEERTRQDRLHSPGAVSVHRHGARQRCLRQRGTFRPSRTTRSRRMLQAKNLDGLLARFEQGLDTKVTAGGDGVSLGQKQLIAFMRAVLREPEILVLDEATANIDTVTEQLLEQILRELPAVDDQGRHRPPSEHDRERRRDLLHQRRRDHLGRLDGPRARTAAARQTAQLTTLVEPHCFAGTGSRGAPFVIGGR